MNKKPWETEPNSKKWIDRETGLTCLIQRAPQMKHLCGYVRIPTDSGLCRRLARYSKIPSVRIGRKTYFKFATGHRSLRQISIHGGVTWAGRKHGQRGFWIGFDCAHYFDLVPEFLRMGIKASSFANNTTYRNFEYVESCCEVLAKQLKELIDG